VHTDRQTDRQTDTYRETLKTISASFSNSMLISYHITCFAVLNQPIRPPLTDMPISPA